MTVSRNIISSFCMFPFISLVTMIIAGQVVENNTLMVLIGYLFPLSLISSFIVGLISVFTKE